MRRALVPALLLATACGGAPPEPATPEPEPAPNVASGPDRAPPKPASENTEKPDEPEPEPSPAPASEPEPEPEPEGPSRSPIETIGAPTVSFMLNWSSSDIKEKVEKKCDAAAGDDMEVRAACLKKERADFVAEVLRFKKDEAGRWWWTIYQRRGAALPEVYKAQIEFEDEKKASVTVRVLGNEKGSRTIAMMKKKVEVRVPNDYSLEVDDPRFGKLVYDAKMGLIGGK